MREGDVGLYLEGSGLLGKLRGPRGAVARVGQGEGPCACAAVCSRGVRVRVCVSAGTALPGLNACVMSVYLEAEAALGLGRLGAQRVLEGGAAQRLLRAQRRHVRLVLGCLLRELCAQRSYLRLECSARRGGRGLRGGAGGAAAGSRRFRLQGAR